MNILILNGGPGNGRGPVSREIRDAVANAAGSKGWNVAAYDLDGMDIKPCRGCFACWLKHPGTCAIKDDEEAILKSMAGSDIMVWITPVVFGGYSPILKKALDRSIPNFLPFFIKTHGEIHHPQRYEKRRSFLSFGTLPAPNPQSEKIFNDLVRRNSINLSVVFTTSRVFHDGETGAEIGNPVKELLDAAKEAL